MVHRAAPLLLVLAGCSCSTSSEPVGDALEPGVHYGNGAASPPDRVAAVRAWVDSHSGPCRDACCEVLEGVCSYADTCANADSEPYDVFTCAGHTLTCEDARAATRGDAMGLSECWRSCEGLQ